jgi:hypothetical protein
MIGDESRKFVYFDVSRECRTKQKRVFVRYFFVLYRSVNEADLVINLGNDAA